MKISIICATFNRREYLEIILRQIFSQKIPDRVDLHVIVVVDGSTDGTYEMLAERFPQIIVIQGTGQWWWTKCMNAGFKKAIEIGSEYALILNDDVEIRQDYLLTLLADYATLPKNSILGSASVSKGNPTLIESAGTKNFIRWRLKFLPYYKGFKKIESDFTGIKPTYTLSGRGTLIPIKLFEKYGLYDEKLVQYGSDEEFVFRAKLRGRDAFISWNALIYNNTMLTSKGSAFKKENICVFIKSFLSRYSVNSLQKTIYLYKKYGYKILLPGYLIYFICGTFKAYLFNYKDHE